MAEEILAIFPAFEIWGLNRKTRCHIVLSNERIVVVKGERGQTGRMSLPSVTKGKLESAGMDAFLSVNHYSIPYDSVRWVEIRRFLAGSLLKIGTAGGGCRFKLGKRSSLKLGERLKELLGDLVREPGR